jgi:ketosteroid isomerase-like protein
MTRLGIIAAALLTFALPVNAQSPDEAAVARAMDALSQAIIAADKQKLESLAAPELSYGHSDARVQDRAVFIDSLLTRKSVFKTLESTKQTIAIVGDTAIVRNHMSADIEPGGKPGHVELEMLYIWQKRGGEWKLLARQAYKI